MRRGLTEEEYNSYGRIPANAVERYETYFLEKEITNDKFQELFLKAKFFYEENLKDSEKFNNYPIGERREALAEWLNTNKLPLWVKLDNKEDEVKENIVKKTCKELGLTYKQLGEVIGYSESNLNKVASTGQVSNQLSRVIELYLENQELKKELENSNKIKSTLKEWLK